MRAPLVGAAVLSVLLPAAGHAQSLTLTESEALTRLSDDSPRVRALRAATEVARAEVLTVGRWPNPRVTYDREAVAGITENIASVTQPLPITGRRRLEVRAASAMVEATESRADESVRRARADLRHAFTELVVAQARERDLQTIRARLSEVVQILERRESAGDSAGFDRLRAERELGDLDADAALAGVERVRAQGAVAAFFVGVDPTTLVAVDRMARTELPTLAALIERAEASRGELAALRHEAAAAGFSAQAADRRRLPEPEIIGGTKTSTVEGGDLGTVLSLVATLPLFDRGHPDRALAEAKQRQAVARAEVFRQALRAEIASLRDVVERRRQAATQYRDSALRGVDQIERIARLSYDAGERSILELLDAYRTRLAASVRQATLDLAVRQAEIELEFATGWEMP
jgi:outer membrane protein, heavy metal efflux system